MVNDVFDIIILGGQSNAEGYGKGEVTEEYDKDEDILWLFDNSNPHFEKGQDGKDFLSIAYPSKTYIEVADEPNSDSGKTGKLALFFAKNYKKSGYLAEGRKILIINSAVGGTGFARKEWGVGNVLYNRLLSMTEEALSMNKNNKIVAFLWHQGECDSVENSSFTEHEKYRYYYDNLRFQTESIFKHFNAEIPFIAGGFADEWHNKNIKICKPVLKAIKNVCQDINGKFVDTKGLLSNNQKTGNGDDIHFCRESLHILGEKYFIEFTRIDNSKK